MWRGRLAFTQTKRTCLPVKMATLLSTKLEIWPQRPRYFAAAVGVHCPKGSGNIHGEGANKSRWRSNATLRLFQKRRSKKIFWSTLRQGAQSPKLLILNFQPKTPEAVWHLEWKWSQVPHAPLLTAERAIFLSTRVRHVCSPSNKSKSYEICRQGRRAVGSEEPQAETAFLRVAQRRDFPGAMVSPQWNHLGVKRHRPKTTCLGSQ